MVNPLNNNLEEIIKNKRLIKRDVIKKYYNGGLI